MRYSAQYDTARLTDTDVRFDLFKLCGIKRSVGERSELFACRVPVVWPHSHNLVQKSSSPRPRLRKVFITRDLAMKTAFAVISSSRAT